MKYFLIGAFATGFLVYGMALLYGATGTASLTKMHVVLSSANLMNPGLVVAGGFLLIVAFGFKVAAVPFHMWAPDAYEGAPTPVTAFMAAAVKAAAFAAMLRMFGLALGGDIVPFGTLGWASPLVVIAAITITIGNISAVRQDNIKRMLAYSSISHGTGDRVPVRQRRLRHAGRRLPCDRSGWSDRQGSLSLYETGLVPVSSRKVMSFARTLAAIATVPMAATLYFGVFWTWFAFWRRHPVLTYTLMLGTLGGVVVIVYAYRADLLAPTFEPHVAVRIVGWIILALAMLLACIADRQLGFRVRSFAPFFDDDAKITLRATGSYAVVRHPIYASGIYFQIGVFLVTGVAAVAMSCVMFGLGALWFTRQEERRLRERLVDPTAYDRYRARVPALLPWPRP